MRALDATTLRGLWSAVPTPWNSALQLDAGVLARNCARLAQAGMDGIYTTDSDGEFYAIELDEFRSLARAFGKALESCGRDIDAAMGVTWSHTAGVIDRIKASLDAGILNVHVAFPIFMPLAATDVDRFFDDLATAAPQARWIHYAHPRCGPNLTGKDYARLGARFPKQFIGTKLGTTDTTALTEIISRSPDLAHFVVDTTLLPGMQLGAVGCYSYWCNTLPRWHRGYFDACIAGRWDEAQACHMKLMAWELNHISKIRAHGHLHGIISKARGALSGFLEDSGLTRPPYYPVPENLQTELKRAFDEHWRDEFENEKLSPVTRAFQPVPEALESKDRSHGLKARVTNKG
jgi:4-hydroxy-tetrahydrodipicolinate synthase